MSQENQSCLRFSLEESLWFRKGQEVAELVSISLDPDITIQENDQYVTIRGSLELTGEYRSYENSDAEEVENVTKQKYVERVDAQEEGICEFSHRFPVDITIPNNRIQSIYDIDVIVETFDYTFPERSCLKLSAELMISGLYDSSQSGQVEEAQAVQEEAVEEEEYEVLHRIQNETQEYAQLEQEQQEEQEDQEEDTFLFEVETRKKQEEEPAASFPQFPTFSYQPQEEPVYLQETRSESPSMEEEEQVIDLAEDQEQVEPAAEEQEAVEEAADESSSSPDEGPKHIFKKKASKKKTMTLTEFFARKEESSEQARLKMCIVQKGDTVQSIADRYDVSVPNLLRVNNLELGNDVYEGQVLYVPAALAKK